MPELRVRQLHRRIAAADAVGQRVVVERQRDGQAGEVVGHGGMVGRAARGSTASPRIGADRPYTSADGHRRLLRDPRAWSAARPTPTSSRPTAGSRSAGTRTSTRSPRRRSSSRRSTRPTRSCPTRSAGSATTCSGRSAPRAGRAGFGGFADIFDAFFGAAAAGTRRRGRPAAGSDLRYDLRITFEEAILGTQKEIEFPVLARCDTCGGNGAKPGTEPITCPQCNGRGEVRGVRNTMLGQMINVTTCPRCKGDGRIVETPCETCKGEGRVERTRTLQVTIPPGIDEGHQIRLSNEGEAGPRGGPPGSLYVAVHVAPHPALKREGTELIFEASGRARAGRARDDDPRADGRGRGGRRGQGGHAARDRDPAARQGRAVPAPLRPARRPARPRRRRRPEPALAGAARGARGLRRRRPARSSARAELLDKVRDKLA